MKAYWGSGGTVLPFLTSTLDGGVVSFTPRPFYLQGKRLDAVARRKIPSPYRDSKLRSSSP